MNKGTINRAWCGGLFGVVMFCALGVGCQEHVVSTSRYGRDSATVSGDQQPSSFIVEDVNPAPESRHGFFNKLFGGIGDLFKSEPEQPTQPGYRAY